MSAPVTEMIYNFSGSRTDEEYAKCIWSSLSLSVKQCHIISTCNLTSLTCTDAVLKNSSLRQQLSMKLYIIERVNFLYDSNLFPSKLDETLICRLRVRNIHLTVTERVVKSMASKLMLLGQVLHREALKPRIVNVRVVQQVFDKHLNMFFPEPEDFKAAENAVKVNSGDIVKLVKMNERLSVEVEHEITEVVFPIGRTVDPVTGRRCRGLKFIDDKSRSEEATRIADAKTSKNYPL